MTYDNPLGKYLIAIFLAILLFKFIYITYKILILSVEDNFAYVYPKQETTYENRSREYSSYEKQKHYKREENRRESRQLRIPGNMSRFTNDLNYFRNCKDPYEVLNCSTYATASMIKKNYRQLALKWHPDAIIGRGATQEEIVQATQILQIINLAYPEALRRVG